MPEAPVFAADAAGIARAAEILRGGGLVAFPTETVYGLGADATDAQAVAHLFEVKGRPSFNPLIAHVADIAAARRVARFDATAERLADAFWPGPLTLVLAAREGAVAPLARAGLPTVGVRVPEHPAAQRLLEAVGRPVAAPSANPSGRVSPTTAAHVRSTLGGRIDAILDAGPCAVGVESTIVGLVGRPSLLRPGGLPLEAVEACLGGPLAAAAQGIDAPGQLRSHYAPSVPVRLGAATARQGETFLGFGPIDGDINLSPSGDLVEAAARLFAALHELDATGAVGIAVAPIPDRGLGRAINDRLRRAAAPRD